jgi:hypothetical protein
MDYLFQNAFISVFAAVMSLLAAILSQYFSKRMRRDREKSKEEVVSIAGAVQKEEEAKKATAIERVIEKIPIGLSPEQFSTLVDQIIFRLPSSSTENSVTSPAVESLINNYHEQALSQARAQFWFSIVAASMGFIWILIAAADIRPDNFATISKTLPGVVMDAVAFLFFRQASETRQRATELYDRLRRDKQMTESLRLVTSIEDLRVRSAVKAQMALHMSGLDPAPIDLTKFLSVAESDDELA